MSRKPLHIVDFWFGPPRRNASAVMVETPWHWFLNLTLYILHFPCSARRGQKCIQWVFFHRFVIFQVSCTCRNIIYCFLTLKQYFLQLFLRFNISVGNSVGSRSYRSVISTNLLHFAPFSQLSAPLRYRSMIINKDFWKNSKCRELREFKKPKK